jgi:hydrogenase maturation protease
MGTEVGKAKTLLLGIGNPIRGDDGVGIRIAEECRRKLHGSQVDIADTSVAGLSLLDIMAGYDKAIIIDGIQTVGGQPGKIYRLGPEMFHSTRNFAFSHDLNFTTVLQFGKATGLIMPEIIVIFAIELADVSTFSEECTPEVKEAIPLCVEMVLQELNADLAI